MLLGGLWHGASWRFVIWGGLHGAALAFHKIFSEKIGFRFTGPFVRVVSALITFHFVCLCWIFFRAANLETVSLMLSQIFLNFNASIFWEFVSGYSLVFTLMLVGYALHFVPDSITEQVRERIIEMPLYAKALCIVAVIVLVIQTKSAEVQPFIYFQF